MTKNCYLFSPKSPIMDVWLGSKYASDHSVHCCYFLIIKQQLTIMNFPYLTVFCKCRCKNNPHYFNNSLFRNDSFKILLEKRNVKLKANYKKGFKTKPSNYRPISLLPLISKIFEKVIHEQTNSFISFSKVLCAWKFGL